MHESRREFPIPRVKFLWRAAGQCSRGVGQKGSQGPAKVRPSHGYPVRGNSRQAGRQAGRQRRAAAPTPKPHRRAGGAAPSCGRGAPSAGGRGLCRGASRRAGGCRAARGAPPRAAAAGRGAGDSHPGEGVWGAGPAAGSCSAGTGAQRVRAGLRGRALRPLPLRRLTTGEDQGRRAWQGAGWLSQRAPRRALTTGVRGGRPRGRGRRGAPARGVGQRVPAGRGSGACAEGWA
jgi:hypothetical protein